MSSVQPTPQTGQPLADEDAPSGGAAGGLRQWIIDHDESWLFVGVYITLAVVLSIWISLFWLVAVVAAHGVLEWVRHRHFDAELGLGPRSVLMRVLWDIKLDIALVLFALVVTVYMEFVLGLAGLSSAARAGLAGGARFAGWQRVIRGILLSLDDAAQLGRAAVSSNNSGDDEAERVPSPRVSELGTWGRWVAPAAWSIGDWLSVTLAAASIALIVLCPVVTDHTLTTMWGEMLIELHPLPPGEVIGE